MTRCLKTIRVKNDSSIFEFDCKLMIWMDRTVRRSYGTSKFHQSVQFLISIKFKQKLIINL